MENIENVVEAIIFASGSPILKSDICEKVPELTTQKLNSIVKSLQKDIAIRRVSCLQSSTESCNLCPIPSTATRLPTF